jgi:L-ascorbate metabolism protein UlaG (beta-lactamase superfamily)
MNRRRRALLAGGAALVGAGALEALSLDHAFDHRSLPTRVPGDAERYAASIARLEADAKLAAGAIVHVGHSTHLLSIAGARFVTDPWFYDPAFGALAHVGGPAVAPEQVGRLDAVLVTHDHADHADDRAMDRLDKARAIVATDELAARARRIGYKEVFVLREWQSMDVAGAKITCVPGKHDIYEIGYVVEGGGHKVYFAGDTRLHEDLPAIQERLAPSFAILPVDGTRLRGDPLHVMTPDDAVKAAKILGVAAAMPSHAETWFSDPLVSTFLATSIRGANQLFAARMREGLPAVRCVVPRPGELVPLA